MAAEKLIYIPFPNDVTQYYHLCKLQLVVQRFGYLIKKAVSIHIIGVINQLITASY